MDKIKEVQKIIPVILCGGSGTRLWPVSREKAPKQFHSIVGDESLLISTLKRAQECTGCNASDIISVTADTIKKETVHQLADFDPDAITHLISEPSARNTAAAIAYAALRAKKEFGKDAVLWIMPADHYVEDPQTLKDAVARAACLASEDYIVTFGMAPTRPDTGYGYIKAGSDIAGHEFIQSIERFVEKPDEATAQTYLKAGNYVWNSGMFVGTVDSFLHNFNEHCETLMKPLEKAFNKSHMAVNEVYNTLPAIPFDVAIMEKTSKGAVIPCDIGWSDVGSWNSVYDLSPKDQNGNVTEGKVAAIESENCMIQSKSMLIATLGVKDLIIIENQDSILIADRHSMDSLKKLVEALRTTKSNEALCPPEENRPWGSFKILSESNGYKVKELRVTQGGVLSSQMHHHRCEFWTVISGEATVTIDEKQSILNANESAFIPLKSQHRLENKGSEPLVMVEVQCGDYLGEDDIVRFDDIYGRIEAA